MINKNKYDYCYSDSYKCTANKYLCSNNCHDKSLWKNHKTAFNLLLASMKLDN